MKGLALLVIAIGGPAAVWVLARSITHSFSSRWTAEPRQITAGKYAGKNAVYLVRGKREVQIGEPFDPNDEMALDERLLDAQRMKKSL